MAAYSQSLKRFFSVCKLGTGFTQKQLSELNEIVVPFEKDKTSDRSIVDNHAQEIYQVGKQIKPDVWLKPTCIWEVQADCFTLSKTHSLG